MTNIQNQHRTQSTQPPKNQKPNEEMSTWGNFSKEEVQVVNKYMKKCSTSLAIEEMQI
jgi:hypothetical protein